MCRIFPADYKEVLFVVKRFNLTEIIIVVVVLAILLAIVLPNVGPIQQRAVGAGIRSNARSVQTASDAFSSRNSGALPSAVPPTEFIPQRVDFQRLKGEFLRSLPQIPEARYWVDFTGKIWASTVDAPNQVLTTDGVVTWQPVDGAVRYIVYEVTGEVGSSSGRVVVGEVSETSLTGIAGRNYIVSAVDEFGFPTAPTGPGYPGPVEGGWTAVSTGGLHTLAIYNGQLWVWGHNRFGQLGLGDTHHRHNPTRVGEHSDWTHVFAGIFSSFAIRSGELYAWGSNHYSLGLGDTLDRHVPTRATTHLDWDTLSLGDMSLALRDGELWAWGSVGYLGGNPLIFEGKDERPTPSRVGLFSDWGKISAGGMHLFAIRNGELWAHGLNLEGELGLGDVGFTNALTRVGSYSDWTHISTSTEENSSAGIRSGKLHTWGWPIVVPDQSGGTRHTEIRYPTQVGEFSDWTDVSSGMEHFLALRGGMLFAWGANSRGQLGTGDRIDSALPVQIGSRNDWVSISAGEETSFAITSNGELWAWGSNWNGVGGFGDAGVSDIPIQIYIGAVREKFNPTTGWLEWNSPLTTTADVRWVFNPRASGGRVISREEWQLNGGEITSARPGPRLPLGDNIVRVRVQDSAGLWSEWRESVVDVSMGVSALSAGESGHTLAISYGNLFAWGENGHGQLGLGNTLSQTSLQRVGLHSDWTHVSAGSAHTLALRNGELWAWGANNGGQLGLGDRTSRNSPVRVGNLSDWTHVSAVGNFSFALRNGELWSWGYNGSTSGWGTPDILVPTRLVGSYGWTHVSDGARDAFAIRGGELWHVFLSGHPPVRIGERTDWTDASSGWDHSLAIANGELWSWGLSWWGQLGHGNQASNRTPTRVGSRTDWQSVSSGSSHSIGVAGGRLYTWGANPSGQLGLWDTFMRTSPSRVFWLHQQDPETIISGGTNSSFAVVGGALFAWGDNAFERLGVGLSGNRLVPTQITIPQSLP